MMGNFPTDEVHVNSDRAYQLLQYVKNQFLHIRYFALMVNVKTMASPHGLSADVIR